MLGPLDSVGDTRRIRCAPRLLPPPWITALSWRMCSQRPVMQILRPRSCMTGEGTIRRSQQVSLPTIDTAEGGERDAKRHRDCLACGWCGADHLWDASL